MTTEEKFKKLLDIACDNGFKVDEDLYNGLGEISGLMLYYDSDNPHTAYGMWTRQSLNDLVFQTNFFDCLFTNSKLNRCSIVTDSNTVIIDKEPESSLFKVYFPVTNISQYYKFQWVLEVEKGTALEWLFKQFKL
jgi:hypothetical protein